MNERATAQLMRLRRCTVERPSAVLKHVILGNARFLLRGRDGAQIEISLATLAYNLKTMIQVARRIQTGMCSGQLDPSFGQLLP